MRDIDFDELDQAVNNYLDKAPAKPNAPHSATELHKSNISPVRRSGRFMDIVPAREVSKLDANSVSSKPLKYTSKIESKTDILDDFNEKTKIEHRAYKKEEMNDTLSSNDKIDLPDNVLFEDPKLETIQTNENIVLDEAPHDVEVISDEDLQKRDLDQATSEEKVLESQIEISEPILETSEPEKEMVDEIIMPSEPGVVQIDEDANIRVFNPTERPAPSLNIPKQEEITKPKPQIEKQIYPESTKASPVNFEKSNETDEDKPLTTPFLPNARVEKRPLGSSVQDIRNAKTDTKLIQQKSKTNKKSNNVPIFSNDEYAAPIKPKKKRSGWVVILIIMLLIGLGAGGGALAYYLLMM